MNARVVEATRSRAETAANAINALLGRLDEGRTIDVAIVGYRSDATGSADVGCRWAGPLLGRRWVNSTELAAAPLSVEQRVRKSAAPGGAGDVCEQTVSFPVWYRPSLSAAAPRRAALRFCLDLLQESPPGGPCGYPALILSVVGGGPQDAAAIGGGQGEEAADVLDAIRRSAVLIHVHLSSAGRVPPAYFPSQDIRLPPGPARELFCEAGVLPDAWRSALCETAGLTGPHGPAATASSASTWPTAIQPGARGLIYHARTVDLIRLVGLVHAYREAAPDSCDQTKTPEEGVAGGPSAAPPGGKVAPRVGLLFLVDRTSQSPGDDTADAPVRRLFQRVNELLAAAGRKHGDEIYAAMISYGAGPDGACQVTSQFAGPLAGRVWASAFELSAGPIRVDEASEQVPNGIGGLMTIRRRRPIYFDLSPTGPTEPEAAFREARRQLDQWRQACAGLDSLAIVVHCTCGRGDPASLARAAEWLAAESAEVPATDRRDGGTLLYHWVQTESAHRSVAYPADASALHGASLQALWATASPLLARDAIAPRRPSVSGQSRGMVVNGQFDAFWDGIEPLLAGDVAAGPGGSP